ncbi:Cation channel sperm-associated targeting subunit tau [Lemmus lemmus]
MFRFQFICRVQVEFMFSYGNFGYGFSHQLKPLQKIIEPSMFMKIAPPPERTDPVSNVITPQRVEYPAFLSPELKVSVGAAETSHKKAMRLEKLQEKPRERLDKMKEQYKNLNTWMEKSEYLRNLIIPKVASTVSEFVDKGDKEGRAKPVVKVVDQDFSDHALPESGESTPGDTPLPPIHTLQIIEEDETPRAQASPESEDIPYEDRKSVMFPPDEILIPKRPSILRIASSVQEEVGLMSEHAEPHSTECAMDPRVCSPPFLRSFLALIFTLVFPVAFVEKEYTTPVFREDSREFTPRHQKLIKSGLDPFLRNINGKMPFRKKKGQDSRRSPSILSTDSAEHEDQDPPYPEYSGSAGSYTPWAEDPNFTTIHMVKKKSNLPPEYATTSTTIADRKTTLSHDSTLNTTDTSDMKKIFTSEHPVYTITKLSDTDYKLSTDLSSNTAKPSEMRLYSAPSSGTTKPSATRLSSVPSSNMAKPSDTRISSAPSSNLLQPSVPNRLSHNPSTISTKSSDLKTKLSRDPSTILTKLSDVSVLSHDSSNNTKMSSDTSTLSPVLSIKSTKSLDSKNKLPGSNPCVHSDLTTNTARTPASRDKLVRGSAVFTVESLDMQLPNVPFPNYQKESSTPENASTYHPLSSIKLTSDVENRRQSIVLKSIFRRNLQDLSDELFSNPDIGTKAEAIQGSSSMPLSVHDKPSGGTEDKVFEKVRDIKSWLSSKGILNSQAHLSPVVKSVPQGGPGTSSGIKYVSGKLLEAAEINFSTNRKSSFKTKHLVSKVSSSSLGLNGGVCDYIIKKIFTTAFLSQPPSCDAQTAVQEQPLASWKRSALSQMDNISRILQSFPVETLLETGLISVTELEKENQSSLLDVQTTRPEEKVQNLTEQHRNVKSQTKPPSRQTVPTTNPSDTFASGADYKEDSQRADKKSDLPNEHQHLDTEEAGPSSTLENLKSSFMGKLKDIEAVMLKSFLKNIFKAFFKYNQSEKELDGLIPHSSPCGAEHLEKIQGNFNKADKVDQKATLDLKLCGLLEKLSESEVKKLKVELGKHIQHYFIERLSEVGHITKEDLSKVYRNLCQKSEKAEAKEPSPPQDKYSKIIKEVMSFVNSFSHHFVDKNLQTKLRPFLNEILQKYFLKNLSESNLFNEADSMALHPSMSSLRKSERQRFMTTPPTFGRLHTQEPPRGGKAMALSEMNYSPTMVLVRSLLHFASQQVLVGVHTEQP